ESDLSIEGPGRYIRLPPTGSFADAMNQYHDLLERILADGAEKHDRTGTGTLSIFGHQMRFNLSAGFPMLTTKRLPLKSIVHELLWFLKGDTNIKYLKDNGVSRSEERRVGKECRS